MDGRPLGFMPIFCCTFLMARVVMRSDLAVRLADIVTGLEQQDLQLQALGAGQAGVVGGPAGRNGAAALEPVGQVADGQRVRLSAAL
jgi:hypothetical protein